MDTEQEDKQGEETSLQCYQDQPQSETSPLQLKPCQICNGQASGYHFGVISCEACKSFYRRSLKRKRPIYCVNGGSCPVLITETHGIPCAACRLKKCQQLGMSTEAVKKGRYTQVLRAGAVVNSQEAKTLVSNGTDESSSMKKPKCNGQRKNNETHAEIILQSSTIEEIQNDCFFKLSEQSSDQRYISLTSIPSTTPPVSSITPSVPSSATYISFPIIIILLLLLLALLLLCCLCWALAARKKKKEKATLLYGADYGMKQKLYEDQEINMNLDGGYRLDGIKGLDNLAYLGDEIDGEAKAISNGVVEHETKTEEQQEYEMNYEHSKTTTQGIDYEPRIETTLEGQARSAPVDIPIPVYAQPRKTNLLQSAHSTPAIPIASLQETRRHNRSGIGAALSSSHTDLHSQRSYTIVPDGGPHIIDDSFYSLGHRNHLGAGSVPSSVHQYASGHMTQDYHGDLAYPADDMYQGEILLGNYKQPSFSNGQQNVLYTGPNGGGAYPDDGNIIYDDVPY